MLDMTIHGGQFGFVHRYYQKGKWVDVEPWNVREENGEPPLIVQGRKEGKLISHTSDCKTGGFYDWVNFLSAPAEDDITFEELEACARALGWAHAFKRRMLLFGSNGFHPALVTNADHYLIYEHGCMNAEALVEMLKTLQGYGFFDPYALGYDICLFGFEPQDA